MVRIQVKTPSSAILALALFSLLLALVGGTLSVLYYIPDAYPALKAIGIYMQKTRATHTTFAIAWIYLGAISMVYKSFESSSRGLLPEERTRAWIHIWIWIVAGMIALSGFMAGIFSGREYLEYHPICSALILIGWLLFTWNLLSWCQRTFWHSPVYIYMWVIGALLFIYTYVEAHLWLLPSLFSHPVKDIQIQWKSLGSMTGSYNLLVYGSGIYLAEKLTGNNTYAQSRTAFALFGIGLLNSLTNYAHHTYHLPQSSTVKWISFVISMLEIIILVRVMFDICSAQNSSQEKDWEAHRFLRHSKWWTMCNLVVALGISLPPINTLVHGTHLVVAHAMGTTIGIDTFILLAVSSWLLTQRGIATGISPLLITILNVSLTLFLIPLSLIGVTNGIVRYWLIPKPDWLGTASMVFGVSGLILAASLSLIVFRLLRACLKPSSVPIVSVCAIEQTEGLNRI